MKSDKDLLKKIEEIKSEWLATVDAIVDPIMYVYDDYTVFKANKALAKMVGTDIKNIVGMKCFKALANRNAPCDGCLMQEAIEKKGVKQFELRQIRGRHFFEAISQPLSGAHQGKGAIQIYRDRTENKLLEEKLKQNDKLAAIGMLAGGLAHEINNPLSGILAFSQMLLKELPKDSTFYTDVVEIEEAAQRCKHIVSNLLDFARNDPRMQEGRSKKRERVDVNAAAQSAVRFSRFLPQAKKIAINEEWGMVKALVMADRNSMVQLFLNLIQNAFQAMPEGGSLFVRSYSQSKSGTLYGVWEVEDTGFGIDPQNISRIFEPFFTTKSSAEGTGLGLSISKSICEEFGGKIQVESQKGEGCTFKVTFPILVS